jgi:hypothetical protein
VNPKRRQQPAGTAGTSNQGGSQSHFDATEKLYKAPNVEEGRQAFSAPCRHNKSRTPYGVSSITPTQNHYTPMNKHHQDPDRVYLHPLTIMTETLVLIYTPSGNNSSVARRHHHFINDPDVV